VARPSSTSAPQRLVSASRNSGSCATCRGPSRPARPACRERSPTSDGGLRGDVRTAQAVQQRLRIGYTGGPPVLELRAADRQRVGDVGDGGGRQRQAFTQPGRERCAHHLQFGLAARRQRHGVARPWSRGHVRRQGGLGQHDVGVVTAETERADAGHPWRAADPQLGPVAHRERRVLQIYFRVGRGEMQRRGGSSRARPRARPCSGGRRRRATPAAATACPTRSTRHRSRRYAQGGRSWRVPLVGTRKVLGSSDALHRPHSPPRSRPTHPPSALIAA
jgi:hypothetical protein